MLISVKVQPKASRNFLDTSKDPWKVYVTQAADKGKANESMITLLAKHFHTAKQNIIIRSGETSRTKKIEINLKET